MKKALCALLAIISVALAAGNASAITDVINVGDFELQASQFGNFYYSLDGDTYAPNRIDLINDNNQHELLLRNNLNADPGFTSKSLIDVKVLVNGIFESDGILRFVQNTDYVVRDYTYNRLDPHSCYTYYDWDNNPPLGKIDCSNGATLIDVWIEKINDTRMPIHVSFKAIVEGYFSQIRVIGYNSYRPIKSASAGIDQLNNSIQEQQQHELEGENNISNQSTHDIPGSENENSQSILTLITGFFNSIANIEPTNCNISMNTGLVNLGMWNFCTYSPPVALQGLLSLAVILITIKIVITIYERVMALIKEMQS